MGRKNVTVGGFTYQNTGKIKNSYSAIKINNRKSENAGFVFDNKGEINYSFTRSIVRKWQKKSKKGRKNRDGFSALNTGEIKNSFYIVKDRKKLLKYRDGTLGMELGEVTPGNLEKKYSWNFKIFSRQTAGEMEFIRRNWNYHYAEIDDDVTLIDVDGGSEKIIEISTKEEFMDLAEAVNRGEKVAAKGKYQLVNDIDFHGKTIPSIGIDENHPFCGVFDGNGHTLKGFILNGKDMPAIGLFGYLKNGVVENLKIDCIIRGKNANLVAAFCAVNEGQIHCCEAVCDVQGKSHVGCFVGENKGVIERCCVSGVSHGASLLAVTPAVPVVLMVIAIIMNPIETPADYLPIMPDTDIVANTDEELEERSNENKASYEVPEELILDAKTLSAKAEQPYVIKNPNRGGNYDFVASIYMTGSNGKQIEVYRSGRIPVGYHIEDLTLDPPENIILTKGSYDATVFFDFYNAKTGEKGMVDSNVPIKIVIE